MGKIQHTINILLLLLFTAYGLYSVLYDNANLFFIIYLFWFDELIRNISLYIQVKMKIEQPAQPHEFDQRQALSLVKTRFFFLFIYSVFITLVFGFFFHLDNRDALVRNVQIFFFSDLPFNICISIAIVREIFQIRQARLTRYEALPVFSAMNGQLLTLHLSLILGGFLWAITSGKFKGFTLDLGTFNQYAICLPFFIIKFSIDFYHIRSQQNNKTLFDSLQKP
jgi:hypothetical protein